MYILVYKLCFRKNNHRFYVPTKIGSIQWIPDNASATIEIFRHKGPVFEDQLIEKNISYTKNGLSNNVFLPFAQLQLWNFRIPDPSGNSEENNRRSSNRIDQFITSLITREMGYCRNSLYLSCLHNS